MDIPTFFIYPWTYGCKYSFTAAWWFIPCLFICQVVNILIRKFLRVASDKKRECVIFLCLLVLGFISVEYAKNIGGMYGGKMTQLQMLLIKFGFLFPFFWLGHIFKLYIGEWIDKIKGCIFYLSCIIVQALILGLSGGILA